MTPVRKASGTKITVVTSEEPVSGTIISRAAANTERRCSGAARSWRTVCSITTMASSMTRPTEAAIPPSVMMFSVSPSARSRSRLVASTAGAKSATTRVIRQLRRNAASMAIARHRADQDRIAHRGRPTTRSARSDRTRSPRCRSGGSSRWYSPTRAAHVARDLDRVPVRLLVHVEQHRVGARGGHARPLRSGADADLGHVLELDQPARVGAQDHARSRSPCPRSGCPRAQVEPLLLLEPAHGLDHVRRRDRLHGVLEREADRVEPRRVEQHLELRPSARPGRPRATRRRPSRAAAPARRAPGRAARPASGPRRRAARAR